MQNHINKSRYFIGIVSIFIAGSFLLIYQSTFGQTIFQNTIDLLNLEQAHPNMVGAYLTPDKMKLKETWGLFNSNPSISLTPVNIGIIDTRIDGTHPEFFGVDFGNTDEQTLTLPSVFRISHGTAVTGIIGANNISATSSGNYIEPQMNGVLSGVQRLIYSLEIKAPSVFSNAFHDKTRITELSETGVKIVNYSKGLPSILGKVLSITQKIENTPDVLFVVAAGNDSKDASGVTPATLGDELDNVITVGATENNDTRASFSNFDIAVSIAAPGVNVYAPSFFTKPLSSDDYQLFSGTSASAPLVTGVAGLLKAIKPLLTPAEIKQILIRTADPIQTGETDKRLGTGCYLNPNDPLNTGCRLNAYRAVCDIDVLNCNTANLNLSYTPNPAPISNLSCVGISPSWRYKATLAETAGIGITINNFTWDFYDSNGTFLNRQTNTQSDFSNLFTGSSHIPSSGTASANLCANLGGRNTGGSVVMTFNGTDDNGNTVSVFEREILSASPTQAQSLTRSQNVEFTNASGGERE
jgi:hypothetical protein